MWPRIMTKKSNGPETLPNRNGAIASRERRTCHQATRFVFEHHEQNMNGNHKHT